MSEPLERSTYSKLLRDSPPNTTSSSSTPRGPTFLSTSTTPSPPPSPPSMSMPTVANPLPDDLTTFYPQSFTPVSLPAQNGNTMRQPLPQLTPLPLPPLTLKPSTRPPPSLNPPNPTTYTSPLPSPTGPRNDHVPIPERTTSSTASKHPPRAPSHSAQASLAILRPQTASAPTAKPSPKRSPSMSVLDFGPPQIPLRISSIPLNAPPRKLSLPNQKSHCMLRTEEKENMYQMANATPPTQRRQTPPHLRTMKELPSPPLDDFATRNAVMGSEPPKWSTSPTPTSTRHTDIDRFITNPVIPSSPSPPVPPKAREREYSHSRLNSAPPTTTAFTMSGSHSGTGSTMDMYAMGQGNGHVSGNKAIYDIEREKREREDRIRFAHFDWSPTLLSPSRSPVNETTDYNAIPMAPPFSRSKSSPLLHNQINLQSPPLPPPKPQSKNRPSKSSSHTVQTRTKPGLDEDGGWAAHTGGGRMVPMSKTQREKERKKKMKAKVVVEHVDIIKDGFWDRRPWILSGRVG
jgi:hypothetical protein